VIGFLSLYQACNGIGSHFDNPTFSIVNIGVLECTMDDQQVHHLTKKYIAESISAQRIQFPGIVLYNP
jgi:hypothetical protein